MALEKVGVEAIVQGLAKFQGDMRSINKSLQGLRGEGTLLQRAFGAIGESISNFGATVGRIAEVALGVLLRDAIRWAIDGIKELVSTTIEAGNEFQILELRLQRLNLNTLVEGGMDYNEATKESIALTKDQLKWLVLLAAQSPYDATDVANTFTLARSYGFAGDAAKSMTEDILNFSSGMGLTAVEQKRIIINFGQMVQQGKVTQREMNDLARGAFVPVNDVLKIMAEQTGKTMEEMDDFRATGESVPAFMKAFSTLVETRFAGAMDAMAQTFSASTDNVKDLIKGIFGLNLVKPVLDAVGKKVAAFADAFTKDPKKWDQIVNSASMIGRVLKSIVNGLLGLGPSAEDLADKFVDGFEKIATWFVVNRIKIIDFFMGIRRVIKDEIVPWVQEHLVPAFNRISEWVKENKELIFEFFGTLGEIARDVFDHFFGGEKTESEGKDFLGILKDIMEWVIKNKDKITEWIIQLTDLFVKWQILATAGNILWGVLLSLVGVFLTLTAVLAPLAIFLGIPVLGLMLIVAAIVTMTVLWVKNWDKVTTTLAQANFIIRAGLENLWRTIKFTFENLWRTIKAWGISVHDYFATFYLVLRRRFLEDWTRIKNDVDAKVEDIKNSIIEKWNKVKDFFDGIVGKIKTIIGNAFDIDLRQLGENMMNGLADGISNGAQVIIDAATRAVQRAWEAAKRWLGVDSPSKLFMEIGVNTMKGMAIGIQKGAGGAAATMQGAMAQVSSAAVPSVTNSTVVNNSNAYNLTVNSSAPTEPILQDFSMMKSLAGV